MATIRAAVPLATGRNKLGDPRLLAATMSANGGTYTDTRPTTGAPDGGSFFRRHVNAANTTSPMSMMLSASGVSGIPVNVGVPLYGSWYARKAPGGGPTSRLDLAWYTAAGASISTSSGSANSPITTWTRFTQIHTPPATAAFAQPRLQLSGIALVGQDIDLGMVQLELGSVTDFTDNVTINPLLVLDYGYTSASRSILLETIGSKYPTSFLKPARSKSGTLSLLFDNTAQAMEADEIMRTASRFTFEEPTAAQEFDFIVSGAVTVNKVPGINYWTVDAEFREVEPLP